MPHGICPSVSAVLTVLWKLQKSYRPTSRILRPDEKKFLKYPEILRTNIPLILPWWYWLDKINVDDVTVQRLGYLSIVVSQLQPLCTSNPKFGKIICLEKPRHSTKTSKHRNCSKLSIHFGWHDWLLPLVEDIVFGGRLGNNVIWSFRSSGDWCLNQTEALLGKSRSPRGKNSIDVQVFQGKLILSGFYNFGKCQPLAK